MRPATAFSGFLIFLSLLALAALLGRDALHGFTASAFHDTVGAIALMLVGSAYIAIQFRRRVALGSRVRAALLGGAFLFWGGEHFMPPGRLLTIADAAVITIFVVDLSLMVVAISRDSGQR